MLARRVGQHPFTEGRFFDVEGRGGHVDQQVGAGTAHGRHRVAVVERPRKDVLVVPDVLADGQRQPSPPEFDHLVGLARLEVAALVEHVVGRQEPLYGPVQHPAVLEQGRGVEQRLARSLRVAVHVAADHPDTAHGVHQVVERIEIGLHEIVLFQQVPRRIAREHQFGKDHQRAAPLAGLCGRIDNLLRVAPEVPDEGVDLGDADFHGCRRLVDG